MMMGRGRWGAGVLAVAALVAGSGAWGQRAAALSDECRTPELRQCVGSGGDRRACVRRVLQNLPDSCRKALSERAADRAGGLPARFQELSYGSDARQKLDLARPQGTGQAPLLLFVHGGGWSIGDKRLGAGQKGAHFLGQGWAFASTNYRLVPQARVEDQAADVAAAIAFLRRQPGVDADRIVLMGHSAGAHLAALVATDPQFLTKAGVPMSAVRGVVLLDGAGYDVARQMAEPRNQVAAMYAQAFGTNPKRQAALSPTRQSAAPNAKNWLILPVATRRDSTAQSNDLAAALRSGGSSAEVRPQPGKSHATINRELGTPGDPTTVEVDRFLATLR
jgi:acetyl esterase/lipase